MTAEKDDDALAGSRMILQCRRGWAAQNVDDRAAATFNPAPAAPVVYHRARLRVRRRFVGSRCFSLNSKTMQKRFFTVQEANELLPFLSSRVQDLRLVHRQLSAHCAEIPSSQEILLRGGTLVPPRYLALLTRLQCLVEDISSCGCHLKDLDSGLVDFPTIWEGREVYLCWKLGEPHVGYWHEIEAGFAGRRSLEIEPEI
jgi:hypothetical protein